jgi:NADPH-dependent 2,4-dienoyl-CoA reductase/sulfur reductase-like enzyme
MTHTTVTSINEDLSLDLSSWDGARTIRPKRLLLATGIREMSRAARLISGDRPLWVLTTGALQRIAHSASPHVPFRRPVIVGTELVSFSALMTLRHLGARPVAMIEPEHRIRARRPGDWIARALFGVPVLLGTSVVSIDAEGGRADRVASVTVEADGARRAIPCDAVIVTGNFQPEASLLGRWQPSLIDAATGGPRIDQNWRTLDPRIYAAGNLLRPVETASWSFREGAAAGIALAARIGSPEEEAPRTQVATSGAIRYAVPGLVACDPARPPVFQIRVAREVRGHMELRVDGNVVWRSRRRRYLPERRIILNAPAIAASPSASIEIAMCED